MIIGDYSSSVCGLKKLTLSLGRICSEPFNSGTELKNSVISLFSGAGGLDLGVEAAGFQTRVCVEMDSASCLTLRANRDWSVLEQDIHNTSSRQILNSAGLRKGQASLLVGGPPCQPFSKSGFWHSGNTLRMEDPRASTLREYLRVLRETLPQAFLLENVPGFIYEDKSEGLAYFLRQLKRLNKECRTNYSVSWSVLNAAEFGVPQRRQRLFMIGCKDGTAFQFPKPTHSQTPGDLPLYRTAWDAIGDLENSADLEEYKLSGRWARLLPSIPEGKNYLWHTKEGGGKPLFQWRSRYWNFLLKLAKDAPSWTIQASPGPATGPFHWKNRRLTEHELRRLQTFPEDYQVLGERSSVQRQLGNAVPSALAELFGKEIRKQLFGESVRQQLKLSPPVRESRPRATRTQPLPATLAREILSSGKRVRNGFHPLSSAFK